nr:hypothetical protein [Chloroflexia bacterium]
LRELSLDAEIEERFFSNEELRQELLATIDEDYPPDEAAADSRALAAFGLIPEGTDLAALYVDFLTENVAGFYDSETNQMYLIGSDFGPLEEFAYSHEVVHALQDQHLGLDEISDTFTDLTDDEALAITSLYEGDAMAASLAYVLENPMLVVRLAGSELIGQQDLPVLDSTPPVLVVSFLFPYLAGQPFVEAIRADGGWEAVDAAYDDPPVSTEQILHPEKYLDRDDPTPVTLPDLAPTLGEGWDIVDEDVVGELQTAVLLANLQPGEAISMTSGLNLPDEALAAAAGWDGDRYALWADDDEEVLVWSSVWDSEQEATDFSHALQQREAARLSGGFEETTPAAVTLVTDGHAVRIEQNGAEVRYLLAPTLERVEQAAASLSGA